MRVLILFCLFFVNCSLPELKPETTYDEQLPDGGTAEITSSESGEADSQAADDSQTGTSTDTTENSSTSTASGEESEEEDESEDGNEDEDVDVEEDVDEENSEDGAINEFDWQRVLITEVVTDPQQDHNDSSGGNGISFDDEPGDGTVGSTDEYIEIYNGTEDDVDLKGWILNMVDGTDETQNIEDEDWDLYFNQGGTVTEFGSGEILVLGNPTGEINNSLTLELINDGGETVDSLVVDDANAQDLEDEAYQITEDGSWEAGEATPGTLGF